MSEKQKLEAQQHGFGANQVPPTPPEGPTPPAMPPRKGVNEGAAASGSATEPQTYNDAPPSYEDAVANDVGPVNAPRPEYAPPPPREDDVLRSDEKKGWVD